MEREKIASIKPYPLRLQPGRRKYLDYVKRNTGVNISFQLDKLVKQTMQQDKEYMMILRTLGEEDEAT